MRKRLQFYTIYCFNCCIMPLGNIFIPKMRFFFYFLLQGVQFVVPLQHDEAGHDFCCRLGHTSQATY